MNKKYFKSLVLLLFITLSFVLAYPQLTNIFATTTSTITLTSDTDFSNGTFSSTQVTGTGNLGVIKLDGGAGPEGTDYKREITIDNTGNASTLTDYQIKIELDTATLISAGKMQSDCRDIRIRESNEVTDITDYWVGRCNTATTEIWVKVPNVPASSNKIIYLYYNSATATDNTSGINTFKTFNVNDGLISHSGYHGCALVGDGTVKCWGDNNLGQSRGVPGVSSHTAVTIPNIDNAVMVKTAYQQTCILLNTGEIKCWGNNTYGQLGDGTTNIRYSPVTVSGINNAIDIDLGRTTTNYGCAVLADNTVKCWGYNAQGQLGDGTTTQSLIPVVVSGINNAINVTAGKYSTCATLTDKTIKCWGTQTYGLLGDGVTISSLTPLTIVSTDYSNIEISDNNIFIQKTDGTNQFWGWGGIFGWSNKTIPTSHSVNPGATSISLGANYGCSRITDGTFRCWGYNSYGYLGDGTTSLRYAGTDVTGITTGFAVTAGTTNSSLYATSCGIIEDGTAKCWGREDSAFGQLGNGAILNTSQYLPSDVVDYQFNGVFDREGGMNTLPELQDKYFIRQSTTTEPAIIVGSEGSSMEPTGTWESPTDSNVIDLKWNGGWGDGTDGSTAFSTTVANVGANANITYSIRTADTTENLSSASYEVIGTANSSTTFTATKAEIDALGVPIGTAGRYTQIKATLTSVDEITNPEVEALSLNYLYDNTSPETPLTNLAMKKTASGSLLSSNAWSNNNQPYFSWTASNDSQSTVKGYCMYLGTDSLGDPETTKGLLGTSPYTLTNEPCQFITSSTNIDFDIANASLRGGTWLTSSSTPYHLNIKEIDEANNLSGTIKQFQFRYDDTTPTVPSYISLPGGFISDKAATFYWPISGIDQALDTNSGIAGMQYRVHSDGTWYGDSHTGTEDITDLLTNDGEYTFQSTPDFTDIIEGNNFIYLRTIDNAENISASYIWGSLKINTTSPSSPLNLAVTPTSNTINEFAFTWDSPVTYTGQEVNITYCYTINTVPSEITCNYTNPGITSLTPDAYANQPGQNTMYVVARDEANNINYATYEEINFSANTSAPGIPQNINIADVSVKLTSSWKLAISWEEPADTGAGIDHYDIQHSLDGITYSTEATATDISYFDTNITQQIHIYKVRACDSANNCGAYTAATSLYPDGKFTEPATLLTQPTESSVTTRSATVSWVTDRDSDSKIQFGLTSEEYFEEEIGNSTQTSLHQLTINSLEADTVYFYVTKWTDEDGNTGISEEQTFKTSPAPTVSDVQVSNIGLSSAVITFTVSGAYKTNILYGPSASYGGIEEVSTSPIETTYSVQLTGLTDGTQYHYKFQLEDAEEYKYTSLDDHLFNTPPKPSISNVQMDEVKGEAQSTMRISWESNTAITSIVTYSPLANPELTIDAIDLELVDGEHIVEISGLKATTSYKLQIKGIDGFNNQAISDEHTFTTLTDTRPPSISNLQVIGSILSSQSQPDRTKSAQLIISWDTDEPATSQIEFGEGTGDSYAQKSSKDSNLSYNHVVVISNLSPSKVYHLRALSLDTANNKGISGNSISITPKATNSVIELVFGSLSNIFDFLR